MQLDVLIWDEKLRVLFDIFNITKWTYPTYRSNSVTHRKNLLVEQLIRNDSADDYDDKPRRIFYPKKLAEFKEQD